MWQNDTDGSRRRVWKSNWWEIINSFCRSITSLSPHGLAFLGTTGVWCKEVCWTRRFSESHYMVYTEQLDKWQLTSELSKLWKATRKSGRQFCFIFFSLFFSLLRLTLADNNWFSVVFTFHFISLPFSFGFFFFFSHSSFHLFWFQFFCFMSVGRVYAVKKKTASRLWLRGPRTHKFAQFQQSRLLLVVCCVCATLERTNDERESEKERKRKTCRHPECAGVVRVDDCMLRQPLHPRPTFL